MLELFLGAVDRIIIFLKGRQDARRRIFNDIFTPAFDDICLIHAESIKLLTDVQKSLGNIEDERLDQEALFGYNQTTGPLGGKYVADLNKTQAALELRRVEYQATKGKLKATLTAMSKYKPSKPEGLFIVAAASYFDAAPNYQITKYVPEWIGRQEAPDFISTLLSDFKTAKMHLKDLERAVIHNILMNAKRSSTHHRDVLSAFDLIISSRNERWNAVCLAYAKLKLEIKTLP